MLRRFLLLLVLFILVIPASAQDAVDIPLIAIFNEQIYQLQGDTLVPYDACMPDEQMIGQYIQSPDGLRFVIVTRPKILQEALAQMGSLGDAPYGMNLWLCDTTTNSVERILVQPNADSQFTGELPSSEKVQSRPSWSPDGTKLAWSQLVLQGEAQSVVIYDIATGTTEVTPVDLPPVAFPAPPELNWNDAGIFLSVFTLDEVTFLNVETLYSFDAATGTVGNEIPVYNGGETDDFIAERLYVHQGDHMALALRYYNAGWVLLDISSGEQTPLDSFPQLYNPMQPDSPSLQVDVDNNYDVQWQLTNDSTFKLAAYPFERVALAPDGSGFAYADSVLHIWHVGQVTDIVNSDGFADDLRANLLWLPKSWRVADGSNTPNTPPSPVNCPDAPQSQLQVGANAITKINLNVRDNPTTTGAKLGELLPDTVVSVVNGPECADGYAWYFVQFEGLMGWVAEGTGDSYFIVPSP